MSLETIRIGVVGACGRGGCYETAYENLPGVRVQAVCDTDAGQLTRAAARLNASEQYTNYDHMLDRCRLDAVILGTPMPCHASQAIAALQRNLHVLCEIPAGVSMEECRRLVLACRRSKAVYMMAENYIFTRSNMLIAELLRGGLFGTLYYGEGEYIHELKTLNEQSRWRRRWQTGINGLTYPTHSLGPLLRWMTPDRVVSVCCAGSGHHYRDARGTSYENEDSVVMLGKLTSGGLVKVRVDMLSDRPHAMSNYQLQGTDGCYESARATGDTDRIWLRTYSKDPNRWMRLRDLESEFLPALWRQASPQARESGHGGGDYFVILDFINAIRDGHRPATDIDAAMDMTLPGLISQQAIQKGTAWMDVPDSRQWRDESCLPREKLQMIWPVERLDHSPSFELPVGYLLRSYQPADEEGFLTLMTHGQLGLWDAKLIRQTLTGIVPGGFFVVEHVATGHLVATAQARHVPTEQHPYGGELGLVSTDPRHRRKGLGYAVCAAATTLLLRRGYRRIYLLTDDWRLPAVRTYLKLGYEPFFFAEDMRQRWDNVRACLESSQNRS